MVATSKPLTFLSLICKNKKVKMYSGVKSIINRGQKVKGTVVLMQKNVLDINALTSAQSATGLIKGGLNVVGGITSSIIDTYTSSFGRSVALKLISATTADGNNFTLLMVFS
jgi:linoleate 9S-lipoxygenase